MAICKECAGEIKKGWSASEAKGFCFQCYFWLDVFEEYEAGEVLVIDGHAYNSYKGGGDRFAGFGGREFKYVKDGVETVTRNMWHRGVVPGRFKDRLVDNAEWSPDKVMEWIDCGGTWAIGQVKTDKKETER